MIIVFSSSGDATVFFSNFIGIGNLPVLNEKAGKNKSEYMTRAIN